MSTHDSGEGGQSIGVGPGNDSSKSDSAEQDGSQSATGGSGGSGLTANQVDAGGGQSMQQEQQDDANEDAPEGAGSAATAVTRGFQDTHSKQAGPTDTGLGTPETGANQTPDDLSPKK